MKCPHCKAEEQLPSPGGSDEETGKGVKVKRSSVVTTDVGRSQHHVCSLCGHGWATKKPVAKSSTPTVTSETEE